MAFEKGSRSRVVGICMVLALIAGYAISGNYLYHAVIGLDATAFPAGEWIQRTFAPDMANAVGGAFLGVVSLLLIVAVAIVAGALSTTGSSLTGSAGSTAGSDDTNTGRRRFLTSSAAGAGALVAGVTGTLGHALFGIGKKGDGWYDVSTNISSDSGVVKTHPTWDESWKTARVTSYGRLGRTD